MDIPKQTLGPLQQVGIGILTGITTAFTLDFINSLRSRNGSADHAGVMISGDEEQDPGPSRMYPVLIGGSVVALLGMVIVASNTGGGS